MNEKHHDSIKQYVNDMIGLENDISKAIGGQLEDERIGRHSPLEALLREIVAESESRLARLKRISEEEEASVGAALKEGAMAVTGILAGLYGKVREHPVSRMVRDDMVALNTASISYSMLLTLGLSTGHSGVAQIAEEGIEVCAPFIVRLSGFLPEVVASELAEDAPLVNPAATQLVHAIVRETWDRQREA